MTKHQPRIALIVDNPLRDLTAITFIGHAIAELGARVWLVPFNIRENELWNLAPDHVLFNCLSPPTEKLVAELIEANIQISILDSEGGIFCSVPNTNDVHSRVSEDPARGSHLDGLQSYKIAMSKRQDLRDKVVNFFAWHHEISEYLISSKWYRRNQVHVTGTPRADLLTPLWKNAIHELSPEITPYENNLILVAGSFSLANPKFRTFESEKDLYIKTYSYSHNFVEAWADNQLKNMRGMAELANKIAERFPFATVVYRPHPFESIQTYRYLLDNRSNLHLVQKGSIEGWLIRAKALVSNGSMTSLEAATVNIPSFTVGWLPNVAPLEIENELSIELPTIESFYDNLDKILSGTFSFDAAKERSRIESVNRIYPMKDGKSHTRIARIMFDSTDIKPRTAILDHSKNIAHGTFIHPRFSKRGLNARLRTKLNLSVHWSLGAMRERFATTLPWDSSDKRFFESDVQKILDVISKQKRTQLKARMALPYQDYPFGYKEGRSIAIEAI